MADVQQQLPAIRRLARMGGTATSTVACTKGMSGVHRAMHILVISAYLRHQSVKTPVVCRIVWTRAVRRDRHAARMRQKAIEQEVQSSYTNYK